MTTANNQLLVRFLVRSPMYIPMLRFSCGGVSGPDLRILIRLMHIRVCNCCKESLEIVQHGVLLRKPSISSAAGFKCSCVGFVAAGGSA